MRNGDSYKITGLARQGLSESDIIHRYRHRYSADEVKRFIPGYVAPVAVEAPKPKPKPKRKARVKAKR